MDLANKVWWASEIKLWTVLAAAFLGLVSFASSWTQTRWQEELSTEKARIAGEKERLSNERIATAQAEAANANQEAAKANQKAAELGLETEQLRNENAKLNQRLAPRTLKPQQ
jgi:outer membrane murein-binding lipoprotein Lpp